MDYQKLGFKAGLEIHQQLDTKEKLFCHCSTELSDKFPITVERKLRAVAGELGKVDEAARYEFKRQRTFFYKANPETSCLVELDEQPPESMNKEALHIALQFCKLVSANIVDEIHVMRKTVVDGSNTSGFQRTAMVGLNGKIKTSKGVVRIPTIQIEEDAAAPIDRTEDTVTYRLDRLGIPLIEVATGPDIKDPEHLKETALTIGRLLRVLNVKRGIGTIRQDVNISISGGARVEIKGAQDLKLLPKIAEREVIRQRNLLEAREELIKRNASVCDEIFDVTDLFKETKCRFLKNARAILAVKLERFSGILGREIQNNRRVGTELSDYAKTQGVGGIIHSDEDMKKYNIEEMDAVRKALNANREDAIVLCASTRLKATRALRQVIKRAKMLLEGVPEEVRKALPDGNTQYLRPMPGASRLYPETDIPPLIIDEKTKDEVEVPERPERIMARLKKIGLSDELAEQLFSSKRLKVFERIYAKHNADPVLIATTLENTLVALRRDGVPVENISDEALEELFDLYYEGYISKEGIPDVLTTIALNPGKRLRDMQLRKMSEEEVRERIREIVSKNKHLLKQHNPFKKIMGEVMKELRGKADGKLIAKIVKEFI